MSFYSQKYALSPEKVDAAIDASTAMATKFTVTPAGQVIADLPIIKPTGAGAVGALWNNGGVVNVSNGEA